MTTDNEFIPIYCPHCHGTLNDILLDEDELLDLPPNLGAPYTCWFCKLRTVDWNHVKICRKYGRQLAIRDLVRVLRTTP